MHDVSVAGIKQPLLALAREITLAEACWDHLLGTLLRDAALHQEQYLLA